MRSILRLPALLLGLILMNAGCGDNADGGAPAATPYAGFRSARYSDDTLWLCRPDLDTDECRARSLDAMAVTPDNTARLQTFAPTAQPIADCFYVYPTVDLSPAPANHTDFSNRRPMLDPLLSQAARFGSVCRVFAPLYRQVTIGTFSAPPAVRDPLVEVAYGDVVDAFRHYLGQFDEGRPIVIMGHSQGAMMTARLLQEEFDAAPALRQRLAVALLIGGGIAVPKGGTVGGTFQQLPVCTSAEQTGCVIAYRTYARGFPPTGDSNALTEAGFDVACTNPAALGGGMASLRGAYFPRVANQPAFRFNLRLPFTIETPFVLYENYFSAACVPDAQGNSYLEISAEPAAGDHRTNPVPFDHQLFNPGFLGTHVLDIHFGLGDLIALVDTKTRAMHR